MDIRILRYFLAVAREENITKAAEFLHIAQPSLSKQILDLEKELGKKLIIRGKRKLTLTEEGLILQKRAEEIINLFDKTEREISTNEETISGEISIGAGETKGMEVIAETISVLNKSFPDIRFDIYTANALDIAENLDRGLLDFGILIEPANITKYNFFKLPAYNNWGLLMPKNSELALKSTIKPEDLYNIPIISTKQSLHWHEFSGWLGKDFQNLNIVATYNLVYNASLMVANRLGYAICVDEFIPQQDKLCFRPFEPQVRVGLNLVWKKYKLFSKSQEIFLKTLSKIQETKLEKFAH